MDVEKLKQDLPKNWRLHQEAQDGACFVRWDDLVVIVSEAQVIERIYNTGGSSHGQAETSL